MITAAELLVERKALLSSGQSWPHDYYASSGVWVSCGCPKCCAYYDPTGEETAKYINMEFPSWYDGQSEKPAFFTFSEVVKQSYLAHAKNGFYIGNAKKAAALEDVCLVLTPPLPLRPKRISYIGKSVWDEFLLSEDKTTWTHRTYDKGRLVWRPEGTNPPILFADLPKLLTELYSA